MLRFRSGLFASALLAFAAHALASVGYSQRPEARAMIGRLVQAGFNGDWVAAQLDSANRQDKILEAIARPAEKRLSWGEYRANFMTDKRLQAGLDFWRDHQAALDRAYKEYGVPPEIILGILGVETFYARHMGNYRVLDALATLGFDYPPRGAFFLGQLEQFFLLSQEAHISLAATKGSYAGAMGMAQFIPSSYRDFAVDFDGDGKTDLVGSADDAIGSIANYFVKHGWQKDLPVAAIAVVDGPHWQAVFANAKLKPEATLDDMQRNGITPRGCHTEQVPTPYCFDGLAANTAVAPLQLEGAYGTEYWLTTGNFYTITRYNHSPLYAMAVFQLATHLAQRHGATP